MTFTFDQATIAEQSLTFNIANGPQLAYLQLWSQMANQQLKGDTIDPLNWWSQNSQGLVMQLIRSTDRYSEYIFKYATTPGIDDGDQIFTQDISGIYNYRFSRFADNFIWNLNRNKYNLEPRLWSQEGNLFEIPLDEGVIKIRNVEPVEYPNKKTYISQNETREGYVFLTNKSL